MENPYKDVKFGVVLSEGSTTFRIFFPTARKVECIIFNKYEDSSGEAFPLQKETKDIWSCTIPEDLTGKWYQYRADYKPGQAPDTAHASEGFADPYSKHVTVQNHYKQDPKTYIFKSNFDWEDDTYVIPRDPRDLIIYETHVRDLVQSRLTTSKDDGVYNQWTQMGQESVIGYLKALGVNAVEFLPLHKFPYVEPPFNRQTSEGFHNTWNHSSRNYWGYMTSFFFAPESIYASDGSTKPNAVIGGSMVAVNEFKQVVKTLHKNGISVIMDVVFNHSSLFDVNMMTHHLPDVYLRMDEHNEPLNRSWTGNELRTEHPVVTKLITDSIRYWMEEYHIDGFRFDLAALIDENSWDSIRESAMSVNKNVLLIAEPWGGRYAPYQFSSHEWSSWNDRFRNGIKGSNPVNDRGFIFSGWHHGTNRAQLENWFKGTIRENEGGLFRTSKHTVNYLESHDGYTLGDFIRIAHRHYGKNIVTTPLEQHIQLQDWELRIAKLAAFCLFVSQGIVMIHSGQEFARSKIIHAESDSDNDELMMDHNSYNKDSQTNWIDYDHIELNKPLFQYYRGLIEIRKQCPGLRKSGPDSIHFDPYIHSFHVSYRINSSDSVDFSDYYVAINGSDEKMEVHLPEGTWELLVNDEFASVKPLNFLYNKVTIPEKSAMLLRKLRH